MVSGAVGLFFGIKQMARPPFVATARMQYNAPTFPAPEHAMSAVFKKRDNVRTIGGAIGLIAHTAYHLGEIRQALCTIR
jgi:hypothetical protein